jgi:hypothetical protein
MPNALVEQLRHAQPAKTAGRSDADLTDFLARTFEARGDLAAYQEQYPDFHRDLLDVRNSGGSVLGETVAAGKAGLLDRLPGTLESAGALGADLVAREDLAQQLGLSGPAQRAGDYLRGLAVENKQEAADRMRAAGGRTIARVEDIRPTSPRDYILWALPTFAENAPSMLGSLGAGAAASALTGGGAVPGLLAAGASSVLQNVGDQYSDISEEPGVDRNKAINAALVGGSISGVLDILPEIAPLAKLFPGAGKGTIGKFVQGIMGKGGIGGAARGAVTQALSEGGTEALQEIVQMAAEEYATGKKIDPETVRSRIINAASGGAVVGGPVGAITGALPGHAHGAEPTPETSTVAPEATPSAAAPIEETAPETNLPADLPRQASEAMQAVAAETPIDVQAAPVEAAQTESPNGIQEEKPTEAAPVLNEPVVGSEQSAAGVVAPADPAAIAEERIRARVAARENPAFTVADFEPSRIAKTTSNDLESDEGRGGRYAIAIEKDGVVQVRNVYERKGGERVVENAADLVPEIRVRGTGRSLESLQRSGWTVRQEPFQLAQSNPHLTATLTPAQFDAQIAASRGLQNSILEAINDGRGDRVVEASLKATDPAGWQAVEFIRDKIAADTGASPSHVQIGLGTRVDSAAARDSLRTNAVSKKLASGDILRRKDGKIFGVFGEKDWSDFKDAVANGEGDAALEQKFKDRDAYTNWALAMGELGATEQSGSDAFAAKNANPNVQTTESTDASTGLADAVAQLNQLTDAAPEDIPLFSGKEAQSLASEGISLEKLTPLLSQNEITPELVVQHLATDEGFVARARKEGRTRAQLRRTVDDVIALHQSTRDRAAAERGGNGAVSARVPAAESGATLQSRPLDNAQYRASEEAVARAWGAVTTALRDAGMDVRAVQAAVDTIDQFYRQTGGRTDARRFVELVMKDLAAPSGTDLEVATHEAVHVLFAAVPESQREAIHRAIAKLPQPDPQTNLSLQTSNPEQLAQERLAVALQGEGIDAGTATGITDRVLRFLKDMYLRSAGALARVFGLGDQADAFALRHFRNRLDALLNGDFAPQSLMNALGGRPLTWTERAVMLPGFGRSLGRAINGAMFWAPKVPDSREALAYNLDLAFSRPPTSESETNVRRGIDAVNKILTDRSIVQRGAMYRSEVGSITFEWGQPGNAEKAFRGGYGLSHIIARRALVGGIPPVEVLSNLIETIAYGDASAPYGGEGDTRVRIDDGRNTVILSLARHGKRETWVVTSFDNTRGKNSASVTGATAKDVPSTKATQAARAFSPDDLAAVTDGLKLGVRLRVVNSDGTLYSRPIQPGIGAVDNPANSINREIATQNHSIAVEGAVINAIVQSPALTRVVTSAMNGAIDLAAWFRSQFHFENPAALKQLALTKLDPQTQQPVQGVNPAHTFANFADKSNSAPAMINAYMIAHKRMKALSAALTSSGEELVRAQNRQARSQKAFLDAHREYLNAEGLTSIVLRGVRQLISRERRVGMQTGSQIGTVMQQLRELDTRADQTINREYAHVFDKLFRGDELRGRHLFDLLDQLVNESNIDFRGLKITDIRQKIADRVASGQGSPELGLLTNSTASSRALLATVVAYGKTHPEVLAQIERRRLKNIAERVALQDALTKFAAERDITNQAVTDLPKTAKLEERARILYVQAKQRDSAMTADIRSINEKIAAAETALPIYGTALEQLNRDLGGITPEYTFGDGMTYRVPENGKLETKTLRLNSTGQITDRATLDTHLEAMTQFIAMKEAAGEFDADYRDVHAARHALLEGGYFESDVRKTDTWVRNNVFLPVGGRAAATGLPTGRILEQMFNRFASSETELKAQAQRMGERNSRARDAAIDVLNRGRKKKDMTADRYYAEIAEPAASIAEKARDLLELGLSPEQVRTRIFQRVVNHLLANPATESFVRGKEQEVASALRNHLEGMEAASKFFNDVNQKHGLGVRDERLITARGDGVETAGIRDSMPVGPMTFSRKASAVVSRVYRIMLGSGWGGFVDAIANAANDYNQAPDVLRKRLEPFFKDSAIVEDFAGALATTDTYSAFDAPVLPDGVTRGEADPARASDAWRASNGDIVTFIEKMYDAHGGTTDRGLYAADMLKRMGEYWAHLGEMLPGEETGVTPNGLSRLTSNLMIDARTLDRWPTAWTEYQFFDPHSNHALARRVASQIAFGRDTERLAQVWSTLEKEIDATKASHDAIAARGQRQGLAGKALRKYVEGDYIARLGAAKGKAEFARVERLVKLRPVIAESKDAIRAFFGSKHNQLEATRFVSQLGQTIAFGMLNNPGTALMNLADLFAPVAQGGVSATTIKQVLRNWKHVGEGIAGSAAQAVGLDLMKSSRLQNLWVALNQNDPAVALQYIARTEDGFRSDLTADGAARGHTESPLTKVLRLYQRTVSFGVTSRGEKSRFTALRPLAPFQQFVHETMRASTLSTWERVEDMVSRGIEYFNANPGQANDPTFKLTANELGLKGAEHAAFEAMRTRLAEGYGLELTNLTREAMQRQAGPRNLNALLSDTSRGLIQGMVANELMLEGNLATMTPKAWTSSFAKLVLPLWGWPIRRALQVARIGLDPQERFRMAALGRGLAALGVMAGAGLAMSLLADEYHEKIVGRKRNLRSVGSIPSEIEHGQFGEAFLSIMENVNRAGTFGIWGEVLNTGINGLTGGGDNRTLSFDQRVVMMNSMLTLSRAFSTIASQHGVDYSGVVRPMVMALGGNSALQYLQIGNNALNLDNAESRFVERVNAQNRLRVAGRELGLEVRSGGGYAATPTPMTPIVTRMVLAAYAGDRAEFLQQWRAAVQEAKAMGKTDPVSEVRDSFASRNPLKTVFQHLSQDDYLRLLRGLDDRGRKDVRGAVDRFNAYAQSLDAKAYTGSTRVRGEKNSATLGSLGLGRGMGTGL